jgi:hypothetical protein
MDGAKSSLKRNLQRRGGMFVFAPDSDAFRSLAETNRHVVHMPIQSGDVTPQNYNVACSRIVGHTQKREGRISVTRYEVGEVYPVYARRTDFFDDSAILGFVLVNRIMYQESGWEIGIQKVDRSHAPNPA